MKNSKAQRRNLHFGGRGIRIPTCSHPGEAAKKFICFVAASVSLHLL